MELFSKLFRKKPKGEQPVVPEPPYIPDPPEVPAVTEATEEEITDNKMEKTNIKALEGNTMKPGKVYSVSKESADFLIKNKRAIAAKSSEKVGKVYEYPKGESKPQNQGGHQGGNQGGGNQGGGNRN